jgi:hypothetical protein
MARGRLEAELASGHASIWTSGLSELFPIKQVDRQSGSVFLRSAARSTMRSMDVSKGTMARIIEYDSAICGLGGFSVAQHEPNPLWKCLTEVGGEAMLSHALVKFELDAAAGLLRELGVGTSV